MTTGELAEMCGGALVAGDPARVTQGVSIDSRTVEKDEFYLAIEGHRLNGHDFAEIAVEQGAAGVIGRPGKLADLAARLARPAGLIEVGDPLAALHELARSYRAKFDIPIVAVAGSCGKTTTKDMLASILGQTKSVVATQGNLNNLIGAPLTLLRIGAGAEAAVLEIASNAPGEIERLAWVIAPTAGIITNIGPVHLEGFGDMEGVFKEKSSLAPHVSSEGFLVAYAEDTPLDRIRAMFAGEIVTFGLGESADFRATDIKQEIGGGAEFTLNGAKTLRIPLVGAHNVLNALAAIAAATRLGVEPDLIRAGLERFSAQPMRMEVSRYRGAAIVNDAYNANPRAMREAISTVTDAPAKRKILALGDMLELGEFSVVAHRSLGQFIARAGVDLLYACGEFAGEIIVGAMEAGMQAERVLRCDGPDEIAASLKYILGDGDILLVKGSRGMRMERIVQLLSEEG
jgi:UDP-N-acetylmuramoyl-tripeptide--D-alanyl-D-alanine ligase